MKNYKLLIIAVMVLVVANSVILGIIWFHSHPNQSARYNGLEPKDVLINELGLTPRQVNEYAIMRKKHQQLTHKLNDANHLLRDSLFSFIKKPVIDTATINYLTQKISNNQAAIEKATLYHFRDFRAILTADQQNKFDNIINGVLQMMARPGPMQQQRSNMPQGGPHAEKGMHRPPPPGGMPPAGEHNGPPPPPDGAPPTTPL